MENITMNKYTKDNLDEIFQEQIKNHYLKRDSIWCGYEYNNGLKSKYEENSAIENKDIDNTKIIKFKTKFMTKIVVSLIMFLCVVLYRYYPEEIKNSEIVSRIKSEYSKDYSRDEVLEKIENAGNYLYFKCEKLIPEEAYNYVVNNYTQKIKPRIQEFNFKKIFNQEEVAIAVYNEEDFKINNEEAAPIEEAIAVNSEVSLMAMDRDEILSKNINIIQPVYGTITSEYGARERILEVVAYHTGVDIANAYNTEIKSATDGVVTKAESMNYYYGNNIEIENNGVIFKYAHLNKICVNEGDNIAQGQVIGLMGATGQATGSHLHFEIRINGRTVDPEMIIEIK